MNIRKKLLDALDLTIDDLSEDCLVDILLDVHKRNQQQIKQLQGENSHEREMIHEEREIMKRDYQRMHEDPLFCTSGEYFFRYGRQLFCVNIQGHQINMFERKGRSDAVARQLSRDEWESFFS